MTDEYCSSELSFNFVSMKSLHAILSKGPDDFGCWLKNFKGVYGAGDTPEEALSSLKTAVLLYAKHNADSPSWMQKGTFKIQYKIL